MKTKEDTLDVKIGTPEEAFWTQAKKKAHDDILNMQRTICMNEEIIKLADRKISEEKANSK